MKGVGAGYEFPGVCRLCGVITEAVANKGSSSELKKPTLCPPKSFGGGNTNRNRLIFLKSGTENSSPLILISLLK